MGVIHSSRVILKKRVSDNLNAGSVGTLLYVTLNRFGRPIYLVRFEGWEGGHDGIEYYPKHLRKLQNNSCWYLRITDIVLESDGSHLDLDELI